jgi:exonuclease SbcC
MFIQSIRLKNIKSYGEGTEGEGITVAFEPGVNCVAGKNGCGKTTLIEALGYALFLTEPSFEERFKVATYFLRAEAAAGEIDVTFSHGENIYRVERGVGTQSKRRSKIVQLNDGSTCAMDDAEVSAFLCRLLGFAGENHLSELFSKLVGVKQGRLTWPFDSKPSAAKDFFEPLLDVAVFQESADRLKEAQDRFKGLLQEQTLELATLEERIRERADSLGKIATLEGQEGELQKELESARSARAEAEKQKELLEANAKAYQEARAAFEQAGSRVELAAQKREVDEQRLVESEKACEVVRLTVNEFEAHRRAEQALRELQKAQQERSRLLKQHGEILQAKALWEEKAGAKQREATTTAEQQKVKATTADKLRQTLQSIEQDLERTKPEFEGLMGATSKSRQSQEILRSWHEGLRARIEHNSRFLADIAREQKRAGGWDEGNTVRARAEEHRCEAEMKELADRIARLEQSKTTLAQQLEQISGGVCPFLKEKCRQFDSAKIRADVDERQKQLEEAEGKYHKSVETYQQARRGLEKATREEATVRQLQESIREKAAAFLEAHNNILPLSVQEHWNGLAEWLAQVGEVRLEPLPQATFESSAVGADLLTLLTKTAEEEADFLIRATGKLGRLREGFELRLNAFEEQRADRTRREQDREHAKRQLRAMESELKELSNALERLGRETQQAEQEAAAAARQSGEMGVKLQPFARVDNDLAEQQAMKDRTAESHRLYLGAKPLADRHEALRTGLQRSAELEMRARQQLKLRQEVCETAKGAFDPAALTQWQNTTAAAAARMGVQTTALKTIQRDLERERQRASEWQQASTAAQGVQLEIGRLSAGGDLARLAGKTLKSAAPRVAQHLCNHIAAKAQIIFNQISPEAIELEWLAEPHYGLRITPGDRRFAMLSGGEQTKLALALTLAMIQQFSGLRFAVFDEPTYGVDAFSRQKLADSILEAQKAAGLDQLILVSHDDAFEGKIEHVILLNKRIGAGTEIVATA